jgi:hypothetical protein
VQYIIIFINSPLSRLWIRNLAAAKVVLYLQQFLHMKSSPFVVGAVLLAIAAYVGVAHPFASNAADAAAVTQAPIGVIDTGVSNCQIVQGWSCDKDTPSQPTLVQMFQDGPAGVGKYIAAPTANQVRDAGVAAACGGTANHGYSIVVPTALKDGKNHTLYVYGINTGAGNNSYYGNISLTCSQPTNVVPIGNFDGASCSALTGWACDQDVATQSISVDIWQENQANQPGSSFAARLQANAISSGAVATLCGGGGYHGFNVPLPASLKDGKTHALYAYAVDSKGGGSPSKLLNNAPLSVTCAAPTSTPTATPTIKPSPSPSVKPSISPSPSPQKSVLPSIPALPSASPLPSVNPTSSPKISPLLSPSPSIMTVIANFISPSGGIYKKGEQIDVRVQAQASAADSFVCEGWYVDGQLVTNDMWVGGQAPDSTKSPCN